MRSDFYVYVLLDPRKPGKFVYGPLKFDHEPFYVGKGKGNRDRSHFRTGDLKADSKARRNMYRIRKIRRILASGLTPKIKRIKTNTVERVAFKLECKAIKLIGRGRQGPLVNMTDGGEGTSGYKWSDAHKKRIRKFWKNWHASLTDEERYERGQMFSRLNVQMWKHMSESKRRAWGQAISEAAARRTPEEREAIRKKFRAVQLNMSEEAKRRKDKRVSRGVRRYLARRTEADVARISKSLSKAQHRYWNNVSDEERTSRGDAIAAGYAKKCKKSLAEKNAKISDTIAAQHASQTLYERRLRSFNVMCGVMLRNAGRHDDLELKADLRRRGARFYSNSSNLDYKPSVLRENVRLLVG